MFYIQGPQRYEGVKQLSRTQMKQVAVANLVSSNQSGFFCPVLRPCGSLQSCNGSSPLTGQLITWVDGLLPGGRLLKREQGHARQHWHKVCLLMFFNTFSRTACATRLERNERVGDCAEESVKLVQKQDVAVTADVSVTSAIQCDCVW